MHMLYYKYFMAKSGHNYKVYLNMNLTYNIRMAPNNGMSEEEEPHYRNLVVKINLICQTYYSASMEVHMWQ